MKLQIMTLALLINCCLACNDTTRQDNTNVKDTTPADDPHISTTPIPLDGCYKMVINRDTATMRLNFVDSLVTGELSYRWAEKDHNNGTLKGVIRDSIIIANYTFRSEGMISVRQVAFRLAGTSLVEGYGELDTSGDTVRFRNVSGLTFRYEHPFNKIPCIE